MKNLHLIRRSQEKETSCIFQEMHNEQLQNSRAPQRSAEKLQESNIAQEERSGKTIDAQKKTEAESAISGKKADVGYVVGFPILEITEKHPEKLGLDPNDHEAIDLAQEKILDFVFGKCTIPGTTPPEIDTDRVEMWKGVLEKLAETGDETKLGKFKEVISNKEIKEKKRDAVGEKETKTLQAESFPNRVKAMKGAPSSEYVKLIDEYLNLDGVVLTNRNDLVRYKQLFSVPAATPQDAEIIRQAAESGLSKGTAAIDVVTSLFENENLSDETKENLKRSFPNFDTRTESGIEKYALAKEEAKEEAEKELSQKEEEVKSLEERAEELKTKQLNGEELTEEEQKELSEIEQKLDRLEEEKKELKKEVEKMTNPETGALSFNFRGREATVTNRGNEKYMGFVLQSGRKYEIRINTEGRGFEKDFEKMVAIDGLGGFEGEAKHLLNIKNKESISVSDLKIGNMYLPEIYDKLGLDKQAGEVISKQDELAFNNMMGCLKGTDTPFNNLQNLGILSPQGNVDDQKWEETLKYMRANKNNQNFLSYRYLKGYLDGFEHENKIAT